MDSLSEAIESFRQGRSRDASMACERILTRYPGHVDAMDLLAQIQLTEGRVDDAVANWSAAAALDPKNAAVHRRLGGALLTTGREHEAVVAFRIAIALEPNEVRAHNNLGQALARIGDHEAALSCYGRALALQPTYAIAHNNMGLALSALGRHETAIDHLQRAVALDQRSLAVRINLAVEFEKLQRLPEALQTYDDALLFSSTSGPCWLGKAALLLVLGRFDEALLAAGRALELQHDSARGLSLRGAALSQLHRFDDAAHSFDQALQCDPTQAGIWCDSAIVAQNRGDYAAAQSRFRQALNIDPDTVRARTGLLAAQIHALPRAEERLAVERTLLDREFQEFARWLKPRSLDPSSTIQLASQEFFYLSYREWDNRSFLSAYRGLVSQRMTEVFPPRRRPQPTAMTRRYRVGFVSAHVRDHAVYDALLRGWLEQLDRTHFETCLFNLGTIRDAVTMSAELRVDHYDAGVRDVAAWVGAIGQRDCDALIFPEIGMDRTTLALASMRHAPCQLVGWGHPETSGLPSIDYFLSSAACEPTDAQAHYAEQLVRLPNLGVYYAPYAIAPGSLDGAALDLTALGTIYVCAGAPFKYAPRYDAVFTGIARHIERCVFVFFEHAKQSFSTLLRERLVGEFRRAGLDPGRYLRFIPWQPRHAFFALLRSADVMLDTLGFSGFNTVMQAVENKLPCVAYEGEFLRGRLGSGILRSLGLDELVASSLDAYVDIAIRLGGSPEYRRLISERILLRAVGLYADQAAIDGLSELLLASPAQGVSSARS